MSVKDGLLALLDGGASHGYQLKADFEEATGGVWTINVGQVYTSLQRLERDGLVEEVAGSDTDGERRAYRLTAAGREQLTRWLGEPEVRTTDERDEVAMKILLAERAPGHDPRDVIDAQRAATMRALQELTRRKVRAPLTVLADVVHLDRMILQCKSELDWLDLAEARLDAAPPQPPSAVAVSVPQSTPQGEAR